MTGKSCGIVRCHYGVSSLAAMATVGLEVFEQAEELFGDRHRVPPDRLRRRRRRTQRRLAAQSLAAQRAVGVQTEEIDAAEVAGCGRSPT